MKQRLIKVGGSLLEDADFPKRFSNWLDLQVPAQQTFLVIGGGSVVDQIRDFDRRFALSEESAHWLAIRSLSLTARLLIELVPAARLETRADECKQAGLFVLDVYENLKRWEIVNADTLPIGWHVTSDSIAARLAVHLRSDELVILKSTVNPFDSLADAVAAGFVDSYFPTAVLGCTSFRFDSL